jgi:CRP-like cAMP-binding protein
LEAEDAMDLARLTRVWSFQSMPQWALVRLAEAATEEQRPAGGMVLHQSDRAWVIHFLVTGSVQILLWVGDEDLLVAVLRRPGELLGLSAFRAPYRYTTSVRCEKPSRLVRIPAAAFEELFERDPAFGYDVLQRVAVCVADRLEHARAWLRPASAGPVEGGTP